jgi:hypothetical protein
LEALFFGASLSGLPNRMRHDICWSAPGFSLCQLTGPAHRRPVLHLHAGKVRGRLYWHLHGALDMLLVLTTSLMAKGAAEVTLLIVLYGTQAIGRNLFSLLGSRMLG